VAWIHVAQDRGQWRALVNVVMNLRVLYYVGNYLSAEQLLVPQEGLNSVELVNNSPRAEVYM
jgi:hypothetical protein